MNISRKDFFRKSLVSLGEKALQVSKALKVSAPPPEIPSSENFTATPHEAEVAVAYNDNCLAKKSGCIACMERCDSGALKLIPGVGVRINQQRCTGCGACAYVCPVTPKAVRMEPRPAPPTEQ